MSQCVPHSWRRNLLGILDFEYCYCCKWTVQSHTWFGRLVILWKSARPHTRPGVSALSPKPPCMVQLNFIAAAACGAIPNAGSQTVPSISESASLSLLWLESLHIMRISLQEEERRGKSTERESRQVTGKAGQTGGWLLSGHQFSLVMRWQPHNTGKMLKDNENGSWLISR